MIIRLSGFTGENRALEPKLLPETVGVTATNLKPGRGDMRPWGAATTVATVPSGRQTIYRMGRDVPSDANYWLSWTTDVHVALGANASDTAERTYYTGSGAPKWTNTTLALASTPYPAAYRDLGVPAPSAACTVTATDAALGTETVELVVAGIEVRDGSTVVVLSANHSIEVGDVVTMDVDYNDGTARNYAVTTGITEIGAKYIAFPLQAPGTEGTYEATGSASYTITADPNTVTETWAVVYTHVTDIGEESAPSLPVIITALSDATLTINGFATVPSGSHGINRRRVYITVGTTGEYFFLVELPTSTASTTYSQSAVLGEVLPSLTWLEPPTDLDWLTPMWNGMMAGISGRSVRFCEAFTPYAWPLAYEIVPTNASPVALGTFGQTMVMLTDGNPSTITGGSPDAMDEHPIEFAQSCIAPLSTVSMGHGVAWAAPDGLAYLGEGGAKLLTDGILTRDDWLAMVPSTINGAFYNGLYFGFYNDGAKKGFIVDPRNPTGIYFLDSGADAVYVDAQQDSMYVLNGTSIQEWDTGTAMTATFKSKVFRTPKPVKTFACAEVVGDYPATFKLYADGVLKHTQTVTGAEPFRLPAGFYAQEFQIEVSTTLNIQGVAMAHSMTELATT